MLFNTALFHTQRAETLKAIEAGIEKALGGKVSGIVQINVEIGASSDFSSSNEGAKQEEKDFTRPEGLYLKWSEPNDGKTSPVAIERVNGDCSVSQFIIARDEAHKLTVQLADFLQLGDL